MLERLTHPDWDRHTLGWSEAFDSQLSGKERERFIPARIIEAYRKRFLVHTGDRVFWTIARGALFHQATDPTQLPAVGDWALIEFTRQGDQDARLWRVLERQTALVRQAAGERTQAQVIAANLDHVLIVSSMNQEFNPRRLERYVSLASDSGAQVTLLLNKADLVEDVAPFLQMARQVAPGVEVIATSMKQDIGLSQLRALVSPGQTFGLIGSSGVGKSTIVNHLYGAELQHTSGVRETDDRGRHTTTARQLIVLPSGVLLVDTPGMRELGIWQIEDDALDAFEEISELAQTCKFRDCRHEPQSTGCAVQEAIARGELSEERLFSWQKLREEMDAQRSRQREATRQEARRKNARRPK